jgi:uncharacterized protein (DUF362 family)
MEMSDRGASAPAGSRRQLDGLALRFQERMSGPLGVGECDARAGAAHGERDGTALRFDVEVRIEDLGRFLRGLDHPATLTGTVTFGALGGTFPIRRGRFHLFAVNAHSAARQITYAFSFTVGDGTTYSLRGTKEVRDDAGELDAVHDMTTLFTTLHRGEDEQAPIHAAGLLRFDLALAPELVRSMRVEGASSLAQEVAARVAFTSFAFGVLRSEYLNDLRPVYDTRYENLVLSGHATSRGGLEVPFFLVSGVHDRGFPWGDGELFCDVLLAVGDGRGGFQRYAMTHRVLEGLELDVEGGVLRYRGPLFALLGGYATSFTEMRSGAPGLAPVHAEIEVSFAAHPHDAVPMLFPLLPKVLRRLSSGIAKELRRQLPGEKLLGIFITPHAVTVHGGSLRLSPEQAGGPTTPADLAITAARTFGEAEVGTFRNVKQPTMLYGYLCAVRPQKRAARLQIHSRTLRRERERWGKDRLDAVLGSVVARTSSCEMLLDPGGLRVRPLAPAGAPGERAPLLEKIGEPVLEVNNDHFPTAVFQRRIVEVRDPSGERCLALEEDMSLMRLEPIGSTRECSVACIVDEDRFRALDRVLDATGFDALLESKLASSGKARAAFSVVIKPNFMFAYDRRDRSTYTDPALVHRLVGRLRSAGFEDVKVAEAQSTYGEYFDRRSVREMADYLGYDGSPGYQVVDMTLDADERRYLGPRLGRHPVSRAWREADFRISFAKNKTHAYAYYTLTLKNVYGALPLANKFEEYHCKRDIYETAIEYLKAFPVDYGLVDAFLSADGPFGIFADPAPNPTRTVIGGSDLVAVDWVAASKMGIDPMISRYMKLAVAAFGKPAIRLVGDASPYRPWLNVPDGLTLLTSKGLDANYHVGNLIYSAAAQMDESHFRHKSRSPLVRALRKLTVPLRRAFFLRTGEDPSLANRFLSWLFYKMG